jgi:hypothetical protein
VTAEPEAPTGRTFPAATPPRGDRRRRLRRLILAAALVAVGVPAGLAVRDALAVANEVRAGRQRFSALVHQGLTGGSNLTGVARSGARRFAVARMRAYDSPWLGAWAHVPLLGRPARWLREATTATATLSREATASVARIEPRLDAATAGPAGRLELLDAVQTEFERLRTIVAGVRLPGTGWFLPPVNSAAHELSSDLTRLRAALRDGAVSARGLRAFLAGPSRYVMLAANNAEMRAGGMVLQVGLLGAKDGRVVPGRFHSTAELILDKAVPVPPELNTLYGWLEPGREWRNAGSSPNFPVVGRLYASMAGSIIQGTIDGTLQLDVLGLKALLTVVGPVEVEGRRYDENNVERLVMHDLYAQFGTEQDTRRHEFSALAAATLAKLNSGDWKLADLARALGGAVKGRHLLAWSRDAAQQAAWHSLGIDGALDRDGVMVTVQNHGGNKLDWFVSPAVSFDVQQLPGGARRIRMKIRIDNPTPAGEPLAVAGDGRIVPAGDYRALVAAYLPGWATDVKVPGHTVTLVGPDGPMRVIGVRVDIPRGESASLTVEFSAPPDERALDLLPSGRARPVRYTIGGRAFDDAVLRRIAV